MRTGFAYPSLPGEGPSQSTSAQQSIQYAPPPLSAYQLSNYSPYQPTDQGSNPWGQTHTTSTSHRPQQPASTHPSVGPPQPPAHSLAANGPSNSMTRYGSTGSVTLTRLQLPAEYRIDPPIPVSQALLSSTPAGNQVEDSSQRPAPTQPSLELERDLLATQPTNKVAKFLQSIEPSLLLPSSVAPFVDMGFTPTQAVLGIAYKLENKLTDDEVPDFAANLGELTGMGYSASVAAGALAMTKNDLKAATELCLSVAPQQA